MGRFRTEFQELSSLAKYLRSLSPEGNLFRTIMLSATLSDNSLDTLTGLFGYGDKVKEFLGSELREEPDYWVSNITDNFEREKRVIEALYHAKTISFVCNQGRGCR